MCWNEAQMLPFFFRHYEPWVQRFVIFDNGSTDGTLDLLSAKPNVEVREFPWADPGSFVRSHHALHNACWRESLGRATWVVVTAIDEHLHHTDMAGYLRRCARLGVTCVPALGYEMVTGEFPTPGAHLASVHTLGAPSLPMNKLRLFRPDQLEPNIAIGGHGAKPTGRVCYPARDEVLLLHYKHLGIDYVAQRSRLLVTGLRAGDHAKDWGRHYTDDRTELEQVFARLRQGAVDVAAPSHVPWRDHPCPRFWRTEQTPANAATREPRRHPRLHRLWRRLRKRLRRRGAA
jgi:hypothetical protein